MIQFIKMKRNEIRLKAILYSNILSFIDNRSEIADMLHRIYVALKDVPQEEMQEAFLTKLAEMIHAEN